MLMHCLNETLMLNTREPQATLSWIVFSKPDFAGLEYEIKSIFSLSQTAHTRIHRTETQ